MRRPQLLYQSAVVALLALGATACPAPDPSTDAAADAAHALPGEPLDDATRLALASVLPTATRQRSVAIPETLLDPDDIANENNLLVELLDAQGQRVGALRDVFTLPQCVSGVCRAIRFVLVYDVERRFVAVYHPAADTHPLMKYWDNQHVEFDAADWQQLHAVLRDPPAALLGVDDDAALVVGVTETAPTRVEYQDLVVRGAAFTTYDVLMYHIETRALLAQVLP